VYWPNYFPNSFYLLKMKSLIAIFPALLSACAQSPPAETKANPEPLKGAEQQTLFWEWSGGDLNEPSYILGTMHILPENCTDFLNFQVAEGLSRTNTLVTEIDLSDVAGMLAMVSRIQLPDGKTLRDFFTQEQYGVMEQIVRDSFNLSLSTFETMKPFFASQSVFTTPVMEQISGETASVEYLLMEMAGRLGIPSDGLESAARQMDFADEIPLEEQAGIMWEMFSDFNEQKKETEGMIAAYCDGDLDRLESVLEANKEYERIAEVLIHRRNQEWVSPLIQKANTNPIFVAVGAGHLYGEKGLINLLRQKGYVLRPLAYR
jgi:uncharacterized protein